MARFRLAARDALGIAALALAVLGLAVWLVSGSGRTAVTCGFLALLFGVLGVVYSRRGAKVGWKTCVTAAVLGAAAGALGYSEMLHGSDELAGLDREIRNQQELLERQRHELDRLDRELRQEEIELGRQP